jgi:hypothetical protein
MAFEALELCKPRTTCQPPTPTTQRLYGLARKTARGVAVSSPDCPKDSPVAKLQRVTSDNYGTCTFSDRDVLETALAARAHAGWKPDAIYSYY